ncbi:DUF4349 domain-containing protein [Sphingomonas sp. AR_OL41]|uniref:DUF4349 domain-containing protein n=1 Tax=Sphingomonas sp. AR_OL41 TaxID=3042729 RepID=UPI00247FE16C|nr:DUF4349 domain-containing protein [Sphingomonas sp. AR_OL41]MDH7971474.1 DUF4349 domain-containing protein [Sphingomonas sp. AR_OL41]
MGRTIRIASIVLAALLTIGVCVTLAVSNDPGRRAVMEKLNAYDVPTTTMALQSAASPGIAAPANVPDDARAAAGAAEPIAVAVPRIAYKYDYVFTLPGAAIPAAQQAHVALCDRLGPARCQVLAMQSKAGGDEPAQGSLTLRVDSAVARHFGDALQDAVGRAGGHADSRAIAAEDVSKDMVDTAARLRQRELLVARLTEVLRTHSGKVGELVEAERSVAAAQEEIDQARGWLGELQARVAMSTIDIHYGAVAPQPAQVSNTIGDSVAGSVALVVTLFGALVRIAIFLAPWLVLGALGWFLWRRIARRWASGTHAREQHIAAI